MKKAGTLLTAAPSLLAGTTMASSANARDLACLTDRSVPDRPTYDGLYTLPAGVVTTE